MRTGKYIIDRFEGEFAVCEYEGSMVDIPRRLIPENAKEGSVLVKQEDKFILDKETEKALRDRIIEKQKRLWE
ncbi:MAG TPA: DUF3006 domain-containing protein [Clostridiales bacterium]|nr:DUF3006 domain-containing protein [Clostridiales bacterium]